MSVGSSAVDHLEVVVVVISHMLAHQEAQSTQSNDHHQIVSGSKEAVLSTLQALLWYKYGLCDIPASQELIERLKEEHAKASEGEKRAEIEKELRAMDELERLRSRAPPPPRYPSPSIGSGASQHPSPPPSGILESLFAIPLIDRNDLVEKVKVKISTWADSMEPVFALLIGVNGSPPDSNVASLTGAENDVKKVHDLLETVFHVPTQNITTLLTEQATRNAIITALYSLRDRKDIPMHANIFVYISSHGNTYDLSDMYHGSDDAVVGIIPFKLQSSDPDISGREINVIMEQIREEKKCQITFIFDGCFAEGVVKGLDVLKSGPTVDAGLELMLELGDNHPLNRSTKKISAERFLDNSDAFVALLAAPADAVAFERRNKGTGISHGVFTEALVNRYLLSLQSPSPPTYSQILHDIKTDMRVQKRKNQPSQVPTIYGDNTDVPIFLLKRANRQH